MQRRLIRSQSKKKKLIIFILITSFLIVVVTALLFLSRLANKTLFISPVSKNISQEIKTIEDLLFDAQIVFTSISLNDNSSYKVLLKDGGEVVISLKKNIERQITSLQPILKQLTIDGRKFNRIDFRYDKPLVVYE